jgi:hypothetical protein
LHLLFAKQKDTFFVELRTLTKLLTFRNFSSMMIEESWAK